RTTSRRRPAAAAPAWPSSVTERVAASCDGHRRGRLRRAEPRVCNMLSHMSVLQFRSNVLAAYPDVLTSEAVAALEALAPLDLAREDVMRARIARRSDRARTRQRIAFLDPAAMIPRTSIRVQDARERPAPRRSAGTPRRRPRVLGVDRRRGAVCREQRDRLARARIVARPLSAQDSDRRRSRRLARAAVGARAPRRPPVRRDQDLRP